MQWLLANWIATHESQWGVMGSTEQQTRVGSFRVRIPDLVVVKAGPQPDVLQEPPLLVVEILSPDDTYSDLEERVADYRNMRIAAIWTIDPKTRSGRMCLGDVWKSARRLELPGTQIYVELDDLFSYLDRPRP